MELFLLDSLMVILQRTYLKSVMMRRDILCFCESLSDLNPIYGFSLSVAGNLNNKKEFLLNKIAWELMNPDYQKEKHRKSTTVKKKDPMNKTALSKKTLAARTGSNAENENKKRLTSDINYDVLDKLFDDEKAPKRAKLEKPIGDQMESLQQSSEECLLEPQGSEEEEPDWNEDYSNDDDDGRVKEFDGDADLEFEDEGEDNEDIIW
ncbi:hypothetical protein EUTSA_v10026258mg [Eutrema salsugineum]|uniref:Brf1 TBP-binding domain-containing protein n=1 Tax=Eutrema salsugineum TaxID=72664 RepID=V4P750_EUTSA|nr:hypothetical protein EUTSA_v10026258mg [Eutrema salsugineum]